MKKKQADTRSSTSKTSKARAVPRTDTAAQAKAGVGNAVGEGAVASAPVNAKPTPGPAAGAIASAPVTADKPAK